MALSRPWSAPDVVLMDEEMPVMDGIEATRARGRGPWQAPILMFDCDDYVFDGLQSARATLKMRDQLVDAAVAVTATRCAPRPGRQRSPG